MTTADQDITPAQRKRQAALTAAVEVLACRGGDVESNTDVLIGLAEWILDADPPTTEAAVDWAAKELAPDITVVTEAPGRCEPMGVHQCGTSGVAYTVCSSACSTPDTPSAPPEALALAAIRDLTERAHLRACSRDVIEDAYERGLSHAYDDVYRTLTRAAP